MTREEFVEGYMTRSEIHGWRLEGDLVHISDDWKMYALPCRCEEEGCEGWAMVSPTSRGWHLFRNMDGMSYEDAMKLDCAARGQDRPRST